MRSDRRFTHSRRGWQSARFQLWPRLSRDPILGSGRGSNGIFKPNFPFTYIQRLEGLRLSRRPRSPLGLSRHGTLVNVRLPQILLPRKAKQDRIVTAADLFSTTGGSGWLQPSPGVCRRNRQSPDRHGVCLQDPRSEIQNRNGSPSRMGRRNEPLKCTQLKPSAVLASETPVSVFKRFVDHLTSLTATA